MQKKYLNCYLKYLGKVGSDEIAFVFMKSTIMLGNVWKRNVFCCTLLIFKIIHKWNFAF